MPNSQPIIIQNQLNIYTERMLCPAYTLLTLSLLSPKGDFPHSSQPYLAPLPFQTPTCKVGLERVRISLPAASTTPPDSLQSYLNHSIQRGKAGWNRSLKELVPNRLTFIAASRKPQPTLAGFAWGQIFPAEGGSLQGGHTVELEVEKFGLQSLPPSHEDTTIVKTARGQKERQAETHTPLPPFSIPYLVGFI